MERLTERDEFGNADIVGVDSADLQCNLEFEEFNKVTEAMNRLAGYEDTGLTPEQIREIGELYEEKSTATSQLADFILKNYNFCPIPVQVKCESGYREKGCKECLIKHTRLLSKPRED